jgi:hypothetical protein
MHDSLYTNRAERRARASASSDVAEPRRCKLHCGGWAPQPEASKSDTLEVSRSPEVVNSSTAIVALPELREDHSQVAESGGEKCSFSIRDPARSQA